MILAVLMTIVTAVSAMSYTQARNEALFLTDKMAYELDLSYAQYEAVYEINLDYYLCVTGNNLFGTYWSRRNADLRYVLTAWQYDRYMRTSHFYRPAVWSAGTWRFSIYDRYNHSLFYKARPAVYVSYRGGYGRNYSGFAHSARGNHFDNGNHFGHSKHNKHEKMNRSNRNGRHIAKH
jgi:hypothetical protein